MTELTRRLSREHCGDITEAEFATFLTRYVERLNTLLPNGAYVMPRTDELCACFGESLDDEAIEAVNALLDDEDLFWEVLDSL